MFVRLSALIPNSSIANAFFAMAIGAFVLGMVEPVFNPDPPAPNPPGQMGSYPGSIGNAGYIMHFFGGIAYIACGVFQFVSPLRRTFPKIHRILGYGFYVAQLITLIGNLIFLFGRTSYLKGGAISFIAATFVFNPWWVYCSGTNLVAIIHGDVYKHHIYAIRAIAVSTGNFLVPPIDSIIRLIVDGIDAEASYGAAFWFSFCLGIIMGEICIKIVYPAPKSPVVVLSQETTGVYQDLPPWTQLTLVLKEQSGDYFRMIFEAPFNVSVPPAYHITFQHPHKFNTSKPYTPISAKGRQIEFLIKKYQNGLMSSYLTGLNVGDQVRSCGPYGSFEVKEHSEVLMLAAGTGITPMISILKTALEMLHLKTKFKLVFFNKQLILENQLASLSDQFGDQFEYEFVPDKTAYSVNPALQSHKSVKRITSYTGSNSTVLVCGPRQFCDAMIAKAESCGIPQCDVFAFGYSDR